MKGAWRGKKFSRRNGVEWRSRQSDPDRCARHPVQSPSMTQPTADLIEAMRVLGHPLRYKLLTLMARGPISVGEMASDTGHSLSVISQQLALMRKVGLVQARREAKLVYYSVAQNRLSNIANSLTLLSGGV